MQNDSTLNSNLIANRYRLRQLLGKGSFGQVYFAEDLKYDPPRMVALKLLHPQFLGDPQVREDIQREASVLARFNHPNILQVLDFEVTPHQAYIVTMLAQGGSLASKIRPDPTKPSLPMPLEVVDRYLEQITSALDEAHSNGLIHRDIKPLNILLDRWDRPLLADFGLAAALSNSQSSVLVDISTSGTPLYMAPEQWLGYAGKASDIYAVGVMTYQMITGQTPFQGNQTALSHQHQFVAVPPLSARAPDLHYPVALDQVIAEAMAKDPKERIRPASEFYRRFHAVLGGAVLSPYLPTTRMEEAVPTIALEKQPENYYGATEPALPRIAPAKKRIALIPIAGLALLVLVISAILVTVLLNSPKAAEPIPVQSVGNLVTKTDAPTQPTPGETASFTLTPSDEVSTPIRNVAQALPSPTTVILPTETPVPPQPTNTMPPTNPPIPSPTVFSAKELNVLRDHTDYVYAVAFSPDGNIVASGSKDKTVKLWEVKTGKLLATLKGHTDYIYSVAFSPDGTMVASGSGDFTIKLWEVSTGKLLSTLPGHGGWVQSVTFSPDGKTLASASDDYTIKLWEVSSRRLLRTLPGHSQSINSVAFSPDSTTLASASDDYTIKLWEVSSGKQLATFKGHTNWVWSVAFSPDGKTLASGSKDRTIRLWDLQSLTGKEFAVFTEHSDDVRSVAFSPDGNLLASGSFDNTIKLREAKSGKVLATLSGHSDDVRSVAFSPDSKMLVSGSWDKTVRLWELS